MKGELGRELFARGEYERAEAEFKEVVRAAQGDNRTLAPALKDLGRAQAKAHENAEALVTLERGLAAAGAAAAVRGEIYQTITEVYRADQALPALIKKLEDQHPGDFTRLSLLGALYEETGDARRALAAYRKALAIEPRQIDLRVRDDPAPPGRGGARAGDRRVRRHHPRRAEQPAVRLRDVRRAPAARRPHAGPAAPRPSSRRARSTDEDVMSRVGEFYSRIGESDRAVRVSRGSRRSARATRPTSPTSATITSRRGSSPLAIATWQRILTAVTPRARALAALGDVYLEHEMLSQALAALREASELEPSNVAYKKALAIALERSKAYQEATVLWEALADAAKAKNDTGARARGADARRLALGPAAPRSSGRSPRLQAAFDGNPPDDEAGRTLAEVLLHQRRLPEAEAALRRVIQLAPGDAESYLALERVLVQEAKLDDAIAVLDEARQGRPEARARDLPAHGAVRAPDVQGRGRHQLRRARGRAEPRRRRGAPPARRHVPVAAGPRARDPRVSARPSRRTTVSSSSYFELADLLLSKGDADEADRLFRRVLRGAPDEELVARAARQSMQINLGKGTLASLEQELVPLAIGNPQKSIYRRLLVEMYGNLTFGLVQRVRQRSASGRDEEEARAALARVGQRAVKPLLDALADGDGGQQRVAIDVLGYVANKNAGPALFGFATGEGDAPLRLRAMVACGALRDPGLLPRYTAYLLPKGPERGGELTPTDPLAVAATWGVARMRDPRALPLLHALAKAGTPEVRALAVLGIGALGDRASLPLVTGLVRELDAGDVARAAAAYALGELGAEGAQPLLLTLAEEGDPLPRQMALLALARLLGHASQGKAATGSALSAMADAVFSGGDPDSARARAVSESLRRAGGAALTLMAGGGAGGGEAMRLARSNAELFPVPEGPVQVESLLTGLVPTGFTAKERVAVLGAYADVLQRAAETALDTSGNRARTVLAALAEGNASIEPFLGPDDADGDPRAVAARGKARALIASLEPSILTLARHPDPRLRTQAITLVAGYDTDASTAALIEAASDANDAVERVALAALGTHPSHRVPRAFEAVARILAHDESWALRVLAAEALGRLGSAASGGASAAVVGDLERAATADPYAMVREASLRALASVDPTGAAAVARHALEKDEEPRVRDAARALLGGSAPPSAPAIPR